MVCFWNRLRQSPTNKLSFNILKFMRHLYDQNIYKSKWCGKIHEILNNNGLTYVWNWDNISTFRLKKLIQQRINDAFTQNWSSDMSVSTLCTNYKALKLNFGFENYLIRLDNCLRIPITRFRCGSHNLPISERRFDGICDHHVCPLCFEDIGDEFHYVLACPAFDTYRLKFLDHTILMQPNILNFHNIFNTSDTSKLMKLSKFLKVVLFVFRS